MDPLQEIFFTYRIIYETQSQKNDLVSDTPKTFLARWLRFCPKCALLIPRRERGYRMSLMEYLPFIAWWLLIMGLVSLGMVLIGSAIIGLVIEREDAQE